MANHTKSSAGRHGTSVAFRLLLLGALFLLASGEMRAAGLPGAAAEPDRGLRKIRVTDPVLAAEIEARGGRLLADYGSYQLFAVKASTAPAILQAPGVEARDDDDLILLTAGTIDTATAQAQALRTKPEAFGGRRLHLVQFVGPTLPEWYEALVETGVEVVTYVPNNTYLVYGDAAQLERVQALAEGSEFVQWDGSFESQHKIDPRARPGAGKPASEGPLSGLYAIQLVSDPPANAVTRQVLDTLKRGQIRSQFSVLNYVNLVADLDPADLEALAARPDVVSIQPYVIPKKRDERQDQIVAGSLTGNVPTGPGFLGFLSSKGFAQAQFTASGFAVDVSDSGIDDGTTLPNHFGLFVGGDLAAASRVAYNRLEGTPNMGSTIRGCDGHGTVNAHIVAGFNSLTGFPHEDGSGFNFGLGVAPFVKVGSSVIFDPNSYTFPSFPNLQSRAYRDGARLSTNSWGANTAGAYNIDSQAYDALVRDAQPVGSAVPAAGNQEMVIVFAAGNAGSGAQTVGSPGTAKNVITVGASENVHAFGGADGCGIADTGADSANDIIFFSSRGPTADGRRKPDLVAPGTHVTGGVFQTTTPGANGQADPCFDGTGVCGGVGINFFPAGQQFFTASSGTSHSTPAVAGGAALVRQYFINQALAVPSPAMTKAFLMSSTRYLTGVSAGDTLWSNSQGMGLMDLGRAFDGADRILRDQTPADMFTSSGQTRGITGTISNPAQPLRVTLAWTDAPGATVGNAFKNDLDLTVTVGGNTYKGNVFLGAASVTGGSADPRNNVESVFLPAGVTGSFSVTVTAANINSDGVPNVGGALDQDYALVVYNGQEVPLPSIVASGATLSAESCGSGNGAIDPGERVTVSFALANVGTADTANLEATLLSSGGVTSPTGPQSYGAVTAGGSPVARPFDFTAAGTCGGTLTAMLQLQDGAADLGTVSFAFTLGTQTPGPTQTFSNTAPITIPNIGNATPYPSSIAVSGLAGSATKVTARLTGLSHTFPDDIDVLLVGPGGQTVVLMSDAGSGAAVTNITLTFDDAAASGLPDGSLIVSGTYRPSNFEAGADNFPAPAPGAPYGSTLSVFNGTSPNGTWRLFVVDDVSVDMGSIAGGWSLTIQTATPACCTAPPAGITVNPTAGLVTTEAGGQATFTVVLNSTPTANVTIPLTSSDPTEGTVSPASLTFTPANALTPQTVTVTGVDDTLVDGGVAYTIVTAAATSADATYNGLDPADVSLTNADNDVAGITVSPTSGLLTTEAGGTATFTVVLRSTPTANVTIPLSSSDPTEGTVSPPSLTFTPADALVPKTATVTGVDDALPDGDVAYSIVTAPATSADGSYNGLDPADVSVTNADNDAGQAVAWVDAFGVSVSGSSLTKTTGTGWGNAGAVSRQILESGDGSVAFVATENDTHRMLGLSRGDSSFNWDDIDFSVYLNADGRVQVYEAGAYRGAFGTYAGGDSFEVAVVSGAVRYAHNGVVFYTSTAAPAYPLLVDSSLYSVGATLTNAVVTGPWVTPPPPPPPPPPPTGDAVVWTSAAGVQVSGNSLAKTTGTGWGNAGATSNQTLDSGDGSVVFVATENNTHRMLGLSRGDSNKSWEDIDFSVYLNANGRVQVYEEGVYRGAFGTYAGGDWFQVAVVSGVVQYVQNGVAFYTSTRTPAYPFLVDSSLYTTGATLTNAVVTGSWVASPPPPPPPPPPTGEAVVWTSAAGVQVSGSSLTKTAASTWGNAGAASNQTLAAGDGSVVFVATENDTHRMLGLSRGDSSFNWDDIDFSVYLNADGRVQVYEAGVYRGAFGTYAGGDWFQVTVAAGVVQYLHNGAIFYTSTAAPAYPLLVDSSLYTSGATLTNAVVTGSWTALPPPPPPPPPPVGGAVAWTSAVGVSVSGGSLTKTAGTGWGNAGAASVQSLPSGDGAVSFTVSETDTHRMLGLSRGDSNQSWEDIDFSVYLNADGRVQVYEAGVYRGAFATYTGGDWFQVAVVSGVVQYVHNGVVFYTSTNTPTYPLLVDSSLYTSGATLTSAVVTGNLQ